jgi:DNA-binding response OmpR family regulator/HPt (histidine-containing phosphotransfer) domain-containing protein
MARMQRPAGSAEDELRTAIQALWEDARPRVLERVATLEDAVAAVLSGGIGDQQREAARAAAHKLAGSLGTFGIDEGTAITRRLEAAFERAPAHADVPALAEQVLLLRRTVEGGDVEAPADDAGARLLLAGLTEEQEAALATAARERSWRVVEGREPVDVALLGPGREDAAAVTAALTAAGASVAVTEDAGDRVELVRAGARRLLPPDLSPDAMLAELTELEAGRRAAAATIVGLDDDPVVLGLLAAALGAAGHHFVAVEDPLAFWAALEATPPDLVVLDVQMPEVSGIELCRALRAHPRWRALPVLFLTAETDAARLGELFAAGGDDYVPNPVTGPELVGRVDGRLERSRRLTGAAEEDERTGLLRRGAGERALARGLAVSERLGRPFTVAALGVDGERHEPAVADAAAALRVVLGAGDVAVRWEDELLVVGMPGLDGHDARERLGEVVEDVRKRAPFTVSGGVAEHPADGADAAALVAAAVAAREAAGSDRIAGTGHAGAPDHVDIAVVEDDEVLARLILHALETRGYSVRWIADGAAASEELGGERPRLRADLVLLDWDLPSRDGLTVLRLLAADGVLERTRVIMLTLRASERESLASLELGAIDHIAKPFSVPVLMQRIRRVLAR